MTGVSLHPRDCPNGPHRAPEGPEEVLAMCYLCWSPTWAPRGQRRLWGLRRLQERRLQERRRGQGDRV